MSHRRHGFTLIELLVVIAIIAILAAILFPVFARARAKAQQSNCLSNVKQITLGVMMYATDNDNIMPFARRGIWDGPNGDGWNHPSWKTLVYPYLKNVQILACPGRANAGNSTEVVPGSTAVFPLSYALNQDCGYWEGLPPTGYLNNSPGGWGNDSAMPQPLSNIKVPAETIIVLESNGEFPWIGGDTTWVCSNFSAPHNGMGNYGFCDGHVKAMKPTATTPVGGKCMWDIYPYGVINFPAFGNNVDDLVGQFMRGQMQAAEACAGNK
ncbi:MAG TPA: prepilin-type N-terminal cleavage/methylation domain-containing protein [Armatimonadota bacterium]